jgi:tRNA U34 2-thiouridine synthase MnmA/TrmU
MARRSQSPQSILCVLYQGDQVMGGGIINEVIKGTIN